MTFAGKGRSYIASWIELLKADKRAFFTACRKRFPRAADYLRGSDPCRARGNSGVQGVPVMTNRMCWMWR